MYGRLPLTFLEYSPCTPRRIIHRGTENAVVAYDSRGGYARIRTGELMLAIAAWIAKQERLRIVEPTKAGLERARKAGQVPGRPKVVFDRARLMELRDSGASWRVIAKNLGISTGTARQAYAGGVRKTPAREAFDGAETKRSAVAS